MTILQHFSSLHSIGWGLVGLWLFLGAGCGLQTPTPQITATQIQVSETETPTPTPVWFPPTATFTPYPTASPPASTPEQRPGIGLILFEDTFTQAEDWTLVEKQGGRALLGKVELTITISEMRVYVASLRRGPQLGNFYAEITVNPNLCRGEDEYGLLIRAASDSDYYRFGISCNGQMRLERVYQGAASAPQPWLVSGAIPIGAPSISHLGVWAMGAEMRFFINDQFQFQVRDPTLPSGVIGVFARSAGDSLLSVNFSNLIVYQLQP